MPGGWDTVSDQRDVISAHSAPRLWKYWHSQKDRQLHLACLSLFPCTDTVINRWWVWCVWLNRKWRFWLTMDKLLLLFPPASSKKHGDFTFISMRGDQMWHTHTHTDMQMRFIMMYWRVQVLQTDSIHSCIQTIPKQIHIHTQTCSHAGMDEAYLAELRKTLFRSKWHHYHINDFQPNTSANVSTHARAHIGKHTQWYDASYTYFFSQDVI